MANVLSKLLGDSFTETILRVLSFLGLSVLLLCSDKYLRLLSKKISLATLRKLKKCFKTFIWLPLLISILVNDFLGYLIGSVNFAIVIMLTIISIFLNFQTGDIIKEIELGDVER